MKVRYRIVIEGDYTVPDGTYLDDEMAEGDEAILTEEAEVILSDPLDFLEFWADVEKADVTVILSTEEAA